MAATQKPKVRNSDARLVLWKQIRKRRAGFEMKEIARAAKCAERTARGYLSALLGAGYLEATRDPSGTGKERRNVFRLVKDCGADAPLVTDPGLANREKMWAAMKALGTFTAAELAFAAQTGRRGTTDFISGLTRVGILIHPPGQNRQKPSYRLLASRNTGPIPPRIREDGSVHDANTGKVLPPLAQGDAA